MKYLFNIKLKLNNMDNTEQINLNNEIYTLISIDIVANDEYVGVNHKLDVSYNPTNANNKGVKWSIIEGAEYCEISENTGIINILEGANESSVTVKATSIYDDSIYSQKTIILTYDENVSFDNNVNSLGNLINVNNMVDVPENVDKIIVKKAFSNMWVEKDAPPIMDFSHTEAEVNQMIEDGTIDKNTLYFCIES